MFISVPASLKEFEFACAELAGPRPRSRSRSPLGNLNEAATSVPAAGATGKVPSDVLPERERERVIVVGKNEDRDRSRLPMPMVGLHPVIKRFFPELTVLTKRVRVRVRANGGEEWLGNVRGWWVERWDESTSLRDDVVS